MFYNTLKKCPLLCLYVKTKQTLLEMGITLNYWLQKLLLSLNPVHISIKKQIVCWSNFITLGLGFLCGLGMETPLQNRYVD